MKKNKKLKLVINNKPESPKRKLTMQEGLMCNGLIIFGIAMLIVLPIKPVDASEVYGVSFKKINWAELCPNIQPIKVGNCESQKKAYERKISINPKICAVMFRTAYSDLVLSGKKGVFSAEEFRDTYLSEGIVDLNALPNN